MAAESRTRQWATEYFRAAVIGLAGGLACVLFRKVGDDIQTFVGLGTDVVEGARSLPWWQLLLLPAAGMGVAFLIQRWLVPPNRGAGFADIMEAVSVKRGGISLRSAVTRSLASLAAIATGNSIGREGPIISLASAAASRLTGLLRAPARDRGLLVACGVAAGFAGAYNAPIAGAVFALEIVLGNFAIELFAPVVVASAVSTLFTRHVMGSDPLYEIPHFKLASPVEVVPYILLGVASGFTAVAFQHGLRRTQGFLARLPLPKWGLMVAGGVAVGAIALLWPEVCGNGYGAILEVLREESPRFRGSEWHEMAAILLSLLVVKTIGTAITVGAGGSGGVFTPSMFVGAALGGAFGLAVNRLAPHQSGPWGGYALVGMGCLVAGTTRAPIMAVLVLFEMTLDYDIMVPLLLGGTTASLVARAVYPHSIYDEEFVARGHQAPSGIEETVLTTTRVADVMRAQPPVVLRGTPYTEIIPLLTNARGATVFVRDDAGKYLGTIRIQDVVELASLGDLGPGIIAFDLMAPVGSVHSWQPLSRAFELFEQHDVDELPVVDKDGKLVGGVARKDVMSVLQFEVLKRQNLRAKFVRREDGDTQTDYVELPRGAELARIEPRAEHVGRTLAEARIRSEWGLTVLAIVRRSGGGPEQRILPTADARIEAGDAFVVLGEAAALARWTSPDGTARDAGGPGGDAPLPGGPATRP